MFYHFWLYDLRTQAIAAIHEATPVVQIILHGIYFSGCVYMHILSFCLYLITVGLVLRLKVKVFVSRA